MFSQNRPKLAGIISQYVQQLILDGDVDKIEELVLAGWDTWPVKGIQELEEDPKLIMYLQPGKDTHMNVSTCTCI